MKIDLLGNDFESAPKIPYSLSQFEKDIENMRPRVFDTYILPGFLMIYAWKSKDMKKMARRILFTSGIYMMYRNYSEYKSLFAKMQGVLAAAQEQPGEGGSA